MGKRGDAGERGNVKGIKGGMIRMCKRGHREVGYSLSGFFNWIVHHCVRLYDTYISSKYIQQKPKGPLGIKCGSLDFFCDS